MPYWIPYLIVIGTHSIFGFLEVNGLATEASALDNEIPEFALNLNIIFLIFQNQFLINY